MRRLFSICKIVGRVSVVLLKVGLVLFVGCCLCIGIAVGWASYAGKQYVTYTYLIYDAKACDEYRDRFGKWPDSLAQLQSPQMHLGNSETNDAWGRKIVFVPYNESFGYGEVVSYGRDGRPGGTDLARDIVIRFPAKAYAAWNEQQGKGLKRPPRQ